MALFNRYYQQELQNLRELAVEFSKAHPALAPMLSGQTPDPDVERLLEGVAFLAGLLRQKIDDEFPEIIHGLTDLIFPHYLRPIPSSTMIAFTPKPSLRETLTIPPGAHIGSIPVDDTTCIFRTSYTMQVHPLSIVETEFLEKPTGPPSIRLMLELKGIPLSGWNPDHLRFYLGGTYSDAANLFLLLNRFVKTIIIRPTTGGSAIRLPADALVPAGFTPEEHLLPYPNQSFPGYAFLPAYFIQPEVFLFFNLTGLDQWTDKGGGSTFEILFELDRMTMEPPQIKRDSFMLFVTPAVNLFKHEAEPILLDHRQTEYRIRASGGQDGHYEVYSLDKLTGLLQGSVEQREYVPFDMFGQHELEAPVYSTTRKISPTGQRQDVYVGLTYPTDIDISAQETLSIELTCTNGLLPERLQLGDISQATSTSPELMDFRNIIPPTTPIYPPIGSNMLWHFLSHLSVNYLSIATPESLKELLELYVFPEGRDRAKIAANKKRINGILNLEISPADRLVSGYVMRGREIRMKLRQDHFASVGDMFLFSTVMDYFFAVYSSMNAFTQLVVEETITGEIYKWPPRIGERFLV